MDPADHCELVLKAARAYATKTAAETGDLVSYAYFGLADACEKFDPDRGVPFEPYALRRIYGAIVDGLRKENETRKYKPEIITLSDIIPDGTDVLGIIEQRELAREIQQALQQLPARQRHVIKRHYVDGARFGEIARECCISAARTSQIHKDARDTLRELVPV